MDSRPRFTGPAWLRRGARVSLGIAALAALLVSTSPGITVAQTARPTPGGGDSSAPGTSVPAVKATVSAPAATVTAPAPTATATVPAAAPAVSGVDSTRSGSPRVRPAVVVDGGPGHAYTEFGPFDFHPISSPNTYNYSFATGAIYLTAASASDSSIAAPLRLPQGAQVDEITWFYLDNDPNYETLSLLVFPIGGTASGSAVLSHTTSGAVAGTQTLTLTPSSPLVIDNLQNNYYVYTYFSAASANLGVVGARVDWHLTSTAASPVNLLANPVRLVDTRAGSGYQGAGQTLQAGQSACYNVGGLGGIPSNVTGALLNATAVGYAGSGWLRLYPAGQSPPAVSTLNYDPDEYAIANSAVVRLGTSGQVCVQSLIATDVIVDASGYLSY